MEKIIKNEMEDYIHVRLHSRLLSSDKQSPGRYTEDHMGKS
jgi:hypothetical protein